MEQAAPAIQDLARRLPALEAQRNETGAGEVQATLRVLERLRVYLSRLVGLAGFQALLTRALAMTKQEVIWLKDVRVQADGTLVGFSEAAAQQSAEAVVEGSGALLAQLLGLLVIFIGEALTLRLVAEIWPEAQLDERNSSAKGTRHE